MGLAPAGHGGGANALLEQALRHGLAVDAEIRHPEQEREAARGHADRQSVEFGDESVAAALQLTDITRHVIRRPFERNRNGVLGDADRHHHIGERDGDEVRHVAIRRHDPADPPADHAQFLRGRSDRDRALGHAGQGGRMNHLAAVEQEPLHRRIENEGEVAARAQLGNIVPVVPVEATARRHGRRHQKHGRRARADGGRERVEVEPPGRAGRKGEGHEFRHAAGQTDPVDEACIGGVGDDHLIAYIDRCQQHIQDAGEATGGDDAVAGAGIGVACESGHMGGGGIAQSGLADEGQIAVVAVGRRRFAGARDRLRVGRNVDIEVLEPEIIFARDIRNRPHSVDADAGNVLQTIRTAICHLISSLLSIIYYL